MLFGSKERSQSAMDSELEGRPPTIIDIMESIRGMAFDEDALLRIANPVARASMFNSTALYRQDQVKRWKQDL